MGNQPLWRPGQGRDHEKGWAARYHRERVLQQQTPERAGDRKLMKERPANLSNGEIIHPSPQKLHPRETLERCLESQPGHKHRERRLFLQMHKHIGKEDALRERGK